MPYACRTCPSSISVGRGMNTCALLPKSGVPTCHSAVGCWYTWLLMQGSVMTRLCDLGLGVILPFHSHVAMNAVISDYIPYAYRCAFPQLPMPAGCTVSTFSGMPFTLDDCLQCLHGMD